MKIEFETELYNIDNVFFLHAINCHAGIENEMTTCMYYGLECGDGWYEPIKKAIKQIALVNQLGKEYNIRFVCDQIKEKYSVFTCYYHDEVIDENKEIDQDKISSLRNLIDNIIHQCEIDCNNTCEICGSKENLITTKGYIRRICNNCNSKNA